MIEKQAIAMPNMTHFTSALIGAAFAAGVVASPSPAQARSETQARNGVPIVLVASKKRARSARRRARHPRSYGDRYIMCTPFGCGPAPPGCVPVPGYDFWGNPTGYDMCR